MIRMVVVSGLLAIALIACGNNAPKEVTETRTVQSPSKTAEPSGDATQALPPGHPPMAAPFKWETPGDWEEIAPTSMRIANFKLKSNPKTECYMTILQGSAGGALANINRWRGQMGQGELNAEAISQLPDVQVLGRPSKLVEIAGSFTGMSGAAQSGYMLLGLIVELPGHSLFVKMTGPEDAVKAEKDHFTAFCQSIKETAPDSPHAMGHAAGAAPKEAPAKDTAVGNEGK